MKFDKIGIIPTTCNNAANCQLHARMLTSTCPCQAVMIARRSQTDANSMKHAFCRHSITFTCSSVDMVAKPGARGAPYESHLNSSCRWSLIRLRQLRLLCHRLT